MAAYKARAKRGDQPGQYSLSYGRGEKQLAAKIWMNDLGGGWCMTEGAGFAEVGRNEPYGHKHELVTAWEAWARTEYAGAEAESPRLDTDAGQPSPSVSVPPVPPVPTRKRQAAAPPIPVRRKTPDDNSPLGRCETGDPAKIAEHAQLLHDGLASVLHWAWRNRRDLNALPWLDGMRAIGHTNPDLHAKLKLTTPEKQK